MPGQNRSVSEQRTSNPSAIVADDERIREIADIYVFACPALFRISSEELTASSPKRFVALIQSLESLTTSQPFRWCSSCSEPFQEEQQRIGQGSRGSGQPRFSLVEFRQGSLCVNHTMLPSEAGSNRGFPPSGNRHHAPFADRIFDGTPSDAVRAKACQPNDKVNGIANRDKPDIPPQNLVSDAPYPNGPCHTGTQD